MRQNRARDPVIRPALFRSRQVIIASALALGAGLSEAAIIFVPALMIVAFQVSTSRASFMLLPIVLAMAVGAPVSGRMLDGLGSRVVVIFGCTMIGIGLLLVGLLPPTVTSFYIAGVIIGVGLASLLGSRSEERRVGKECRSRW